MKALTLIVSVWALIASASDTTKQAKKEGWTFHFNEKTGKFSTGLKKPVNALFDSSFTYDAVKEDIDVPDTYDLRMKIGQIENQGSCGSCWSFSLTATLRDAWMLAGMDPGRLSQQYLVDCARDSYGCNGGYFGSADYFVDPKGAPLLTEYPYTARNGRCKSGLKPAASIISWHYVGANGRTPTVQEIQKAILLYGPVSVTVGADNIFSSYESGIYNACRRTGTNHMVNLVGWDNNQQYWIMRNSWGKEWGEDGYMRIKFTDKSGRLCNNLAEQAAFVKINGKPVPPVVSDYMIEGKTITVKGSLKKDAKYKVEDAKKFTQDMVDELDKK